MLFLTGFVLGFILGAMFTFFMFFIKESKPQAVTKRPSPKVKKRKPIVNDDRAAYKRETKDHFIGG